MQTKNLKFCSKSCSTTHNNLKRKHTTETKTKISNWARSNPRGFICVKTRHPNSNKGRSRNEVLYTNVVCPTCNKIFNTNIKQKRKYCSSVCVKTGGLRMNSGRGKSGYYKGFYLSSTYELAYLIYALDHGFHIIRNRDYWQYEFQNKIYKFYPDFRVNGRLVEIKGFKSELTEAKISSVTEDIDVLYRKDLEHIFLYVEAKTGIKRSKFYTLYE